MDVTSSLRSLLPYVHVVRNLTVCSNMEGAVPWSLENEARLLRECAVVLATGSNPGASTNRIVKALRAGRFVVADRDCPASWHALRDFMWIGDVLHGVSWALHNREEARSMIAKGQAWVEERNSPATIGRQWGELFASTLEQDTSARMAG